VFALATFMLLTPKTNWAWNYQVAAAAAVIGAVRLVMPVWRRSIRATEEDGSTRPAHNAGVLVIGIYAFAVATQPWWTSARAPRESIAFSLTVVFLVLMLVATLAAHWPFPNLQLQLTRPMPVWSSALVAYCLTVTGIVAGSNLAASVQARTSIAPWWLIAVLGIAIPISALVAFVIVAGLLLFALKVMRISYRVGSAIDRQRMLWIVEGIAAAGAIQVVIGAAAIVLSGVVPDYVWPFAWRLASLAGLPLILLSFGVAVFYRGALDPTLIIDRTAIYSATIVISAIVFEVLENAISGILSPLLGDKDIPNWITASIAAVAVALLLGPLRRWCESIAARYLPRTSGAASEAEPSRRPAVIVVSDLVGYSAATLDDERIATAVIARVRQIVKEVAADCGGRVIESSRDLALLEFPDAASAIMACRQMFERIHRGSDCPGLSGVRLRAGVHAGDVLFAVDGGVTGRAVIIADRLRERAVGGEVLLSHAVAAGLTTTDAIENLGATKLRGISEPQECFRVRFST
jgi:class 3 adenylate cyclase